MSELEYLFDDGSLFALNKPPGLHSVQAGDGGGASVADLLLATDPQLSHASTRSGDAGLVNRLDLDTSGVLLGARSRALWTALHEGILQGSITKSYLLIVFGHPPPEISISSYIGSPYRRSTKVRVYENAPRRGERALEGTTSYTVVSHHPTRNASLLKAYASPARRHQVRAHAAHLGYPLLGDTLYGAQEGLGDLTVSPRAFFLHAHQLTLLHPETREELTITSPATRLLSWPQLPPLES